MNQAERDIRRKKRALEHAEKIGNVRKTCRYYGISRSNFYLWKKAYERQGDAGLVRNKPVARSHPRATPQELVDKTLHLWRTCPMGPQRIVWYLERYHGIRTSDANVYRICRRHGLRRLPQHVGRRCAATSATRRSTPFGSSTMSWKSSRFASTRVRTDRGHEFQALFHWHVADRGMQHTYIKACTPQLNSKVERSHRTDKDEFYQLITYCGDVDLMKKLEAWERFYNFAPSPHGLQRKDTLRGVAREATMTQLRVRAGWSDHTINPTRCGYSNEFQRRDLHRSQRRLESH